MIAIIDTVAYLYQFMPDVFRSVILEGTKVCNKWIKAHYEQIDKASSTPSSDNDSGNGSALGKKDEMEKVNNTRLITFYAYIICFRCVELSSL